MRKGEKRYVRNGVIFFLPVDGLPEPTTGSSPQVKVQNVLRAYGKLSYLLNKIFSPVFIPFPQRRIGKIINASGENSIILNLGSGPTYFWDRKDIIKAAGEKRKKR